MKIRIKFQKTGNLRFIGHLDVMRFFQKTLRRAEVPMKFSGGFSPHPLLSFATPLGTGLTSEGEYMDIETEDLLWDADELLCRMNAVSVPDLLVTMATRLPDDAKNAMSLLSGADYFVTFREGYAPSDWEDFRKEFSEFFSRDEIIVTKKTKTSEKVVNLKSMIHELTLNGDGVFMKLDTGSQSNCKPELLFETFYREKGLAFDAISLRIHRMELYGRENGVFQPLYAYGEPF